MWFSTSQTVSFSERKMVSYLLLCSLDFIIHIIGAQWVIFKKEFHVYRTGIFILKMFWGTDFLTPFRNWVIFE